MFHFGVTADTAEISQWKLDDDDRNCHHYYTHIKCVEDFEDK